MTSWVPHVFYIAINLATISILEKALCYSSFVTAAIKLLHEYEN
jgi:hypothetical protein